MKRYEDSFEFNVEKRRAQEWKREHNAGGFRCSHCKQFVVINDIMGTANRNHCNVCLWSKHLDETTGDRRATCNGGMEPIGLTFKHEGFNRVGEIMIIHLCSMCQKISINRIARDDPDDNILAIHNKSFDLKDAIKTRLKSNNISLMDEADRKELSVQLFGK